MDKVFILFAMVFCHLFADYNLQGILASMKQKSWWQENAPDEFYKNDYIIALIEHAFMWTFVTMLPIFWCDNWHLIAISAFCLIANTAIHSWIDNEKANKHSINLVTDQLLHLLQIVVTWVVCVCI